MKKSKLRAQIAASRAILNMAHTLADVAEFVGHNTNQRLLKDLARAKEYGYNVDFETFNFTEAPCNKSKLATN